jgi:hypothetical protein
MQSQQTKGNIMDKQAVQQQALANATQSASLTNYPAIIQGFMAKGIAVADIEPRVNVFTFHAWKALGRQVRKGEHGVRVTTWVPMTKKDADGVAQPIGRKPRGTTVFHVSQTEPIDGYEKRVQELEGEGMTRSDAQGVADAEKVDPRPVVRPDYYSTEFTPTA